MTEVTTGETESDRVNPCLSRALSSIVLLSPIPYCRYYSLGVYLRKSQL